jgi:hypothetical protein
VLDIHYQNSGLCRVPASLPSAFCRALGKGCFAESHTRQSPALGNELVYRVQDSRHRKTLGKDNFAEWQALSKGGSQQRAVSGRSKANGRQHLPRAEGRHSAKWFSLPSAKYLALGKELFTECLLWTLGKAYFYFFNFVHQTFCDTPGVYFVLCQEICP